MAAKIIDGKTLSAQIRRELALEISRKTREGERPPGLAVILIGEDPASQIYVRNKTLACEEVGIKSLLYRHPSIITQAEVLSLIRELNQDAGVDGILLQLPLPKHLNADQIIETIAPEKDVDGFHPYNLGRLAERRPALRPCTPWGIMALLTSIGTEFKKNHAVIVGASNIVGRPMALELLLAGTTVTVCHRFTTDLAYHVKQADLLIAAAGKPGLIKGEWIREGATVIDVGISRLPDGSIQGDVEFDVARQKAAWITPVPGGVGPMTIATLLKNTVSVWLNSLIPQVSSLPL